MSRLVSTGAHNPLVNYTASSYGENHCFSGQGVSWMEMWAEILRWEPSQQRWASLNICYRSLAGAGHLGCTAVYDCNHPNTQRSYRGFASA